MSSLILVLVPLLLGLAGVGAQTDPAPLRAQLQLDADCTRFDDPNAVRDGAIVYAGFTAYEFGLEHAVDAWSPARGFAIPLRQAAPAGDVVPAEASLIYRDARIPGSGFKGVTVTWAHAPTTITLNLATLPPPETVVAGERETILAVVTHETGHALGLGDVPPPGVTIRECATMLMKRSVDKGGGAFTVPQPGDIALYCLRWGGTICGENAPAPAPSPAPQPAPVATDADDAGVTYRYVVVKCEQLPPHAITPEQVERDGLPHEPPYECARAPVGMLFHVQGDDGRAQAVLTDRYGELTFQKPEGIAVRIELPEGNEGWFPSLIGYHPAEESQVIPALDPDCPAASTPVCKRVFVVVA